LTFADAAEKVRDGDSGRSRLENTDRNKVPAERLHPKAANWRCRPIGDVRRPELVVAKLPVGRGRKAESRRPIYQTECNG
jgi:hypothetical protein